MFLAEKPMVDNPVPRHAEQWLNTKTIEYMGLGISRAEDELEVSMFDAIQRIDNMKNYQNLPQIDNGAEMAATSILKIAD